MAGLIEGDEISLEKLVEFQSGYAFSSNNFQMYKTDDNIPVVKIADITTDCKLNLKNCQFHQYEERFKKFLVQKGDILIAMTGATVGKIAQNKNSDPILLNQRVGILRSKEVSETLLFTILKHSNIYDFCQQKATGTNDNVSDRDILQFEIQLPHLEKQNEILVKIEKIEEKIAFNKKQLEDCANQKNLILEKYLVG